MSQLLKYTKRVVRRLLSRNGYDLVPASTLRNLAPVTPSECTFSTFLRRTIEDHSAITVIFDVGANEGQSAILLSDIFDKSEIYSFEPIAETFDLLVRNTKGKLRIQSHRMALGSQIGEVAMRVYPENNQLARIEVEAVGKSGTVTEPVPRTTLDAFAGAHGISRIHLLKTDTEGHDLEVLRGASELLGSGCIDLVYTEVGFDNIDDRHTHFPAILAVMDRLGYHFVRLFEVEYWPRPARAGYGNALFAHRNSNILGPWR